MKNSAYVGLDVHKLTMAIAIAEAGASSEVRFFGEIANSPAAVASMVKKLAPRHGKLQFAYEGGPCGYGPIDPPVWEISACPCLPSPWGSYLSPSREKGVPPAECPPPDDK